MRAPSHQLIAAEPGFVRVEGGVGERYRFGIALRFDEFDGRDRGVQIQEKATIGWHETPPHLPTGGSARGPLGAPWGDRVSQSPTLRKDHVDDTKMVQQVSFEAYQDVRTE